MAPHKTTVNVNNMAMFGLSKLFGSAELTPLERRVIAAVSAKLPLTAREIFDAQISQVNRIQRHPSGKEANFYAMRRGKPDMEERFLFPLRTETLLGTVHLNVGQERKLLRAEVWLVNGRVFSVDFNKSPGKTSESEIHVADVEILLDPMVAAPVDSASEAKRRELVLAVIHSKLPDEYLQLVGEGDGVSINDWAVHGVEGIRKIVQGDGNYYLLAEKQGMGAVGVKEDESSGQLYYLAYENGAGESITVGFREFLEKFDGGRVEGRF
jgi:hypothetical protein